MAKSFFIIVILCVINPSINISYNINNRFITEINDEEPLIIQNKTTDFWTFRAEIDNCIPVIAVQELGCALSAKNSIFKSLFRSVCEQHQLCYACGFAHRISSQECNVRALMNMYDICSQNKRLSFSDCFKKRFTAIGLLRQHTYRSISHSSEFLFECQQPCVFNYINAK